MYMPYLPLLPGKITGGLPHFGVPPFSTVVGNQTLDFQDMLVTFGPEGFVMPLVAILESIAIARAFGERFMAIYVDDVVEKICLQN